MCLHRVAVDGIFGLKTEAATQAFLRSAHITADGIVEAQTRAVGLIAAGRAALVGGGDFRSSRRRRGGRRPPLPRRRPATAAARSGRCWSSHPFLLPGSSRRTLRLPMSSATVPADRGCDAMKFTWWRWGGG
ncbi:MAG: peptidoglycan-binding domain-containing protein [Streptosporangiaceae bacterium]